MTRPLNRLALTVYIAMSKQEGGATLICLFSESDAPLLLRPSFIGELLASQPARQAASGTGSRWKEIHFIIKYRINQRVCVFTR